MRVEKSILGIALGLVAVGCRPTPPLGPLVVQTPVSTLDNAAQTKQISISRITYRITQGERIGNIRSERFIPALYFSHYRCDDDQPIHFDLGSMSQMVTGGQALAISTLRGAGFRIANDATELFETSAAQAELMVGAVITGLYLSHTNCGGEEAASATATLEWQVFDPLKKAILLRSAYDGSGEARGKTARVSLALSNAISESTRRFAGDETFRKLVSREEPVLSARSRAPVQPEAGRIMLVSRPAAGPVSRRLKDIAGAVVTVRAGAGHGSGFLIDRSLVLTNAHVVGEATRVRVGLAEGGEIDGRVEARDADRDVALVRIGEERPNLLGIARREAEVGAEVYAIGSPLDELFAGTLTKGVISANRRIRGQSFLQSDVTIHPGNSGGPLVNAEGEVVGVAVMAIRPGNANTGINLFIPIREALDALGIEVAGN